MRILYHHRTMGDGAEGIHIREMVTAWRALGHEVHVEALAGEPTDGPVAGTAGARRIRRLIPGFAYEAAEIAYNVVGHRRLTAAIGRLKPDFIYDRYNSYSTAATSAARRAGLPLLLEVNAPVAYERNAYEHLQLKLPSLAARYERRILQGADRVFAVSTPLKRHLVATAALDPGRVVVLPNGANPEAFRPDEPSAHVRARLGLSQQTIVGFVGILRPWHGVDLLLQAFGQLRASFPTVHLLVVGDGPIQTDLERLADSLGIRRDVTFTGRLSHRDVVAHIAAMDVTVSPQATFYASPMKIVEYMAMQRAVVAPGMENIRDLIDDGETGVLFEPGNVAALTKALEAVIRDPALRARLGGNARQRVVERFNWRWNAERVVQEAMSVLNGYGRRPNS